MAESSKNQVINLQNKSVLHITGVESVICLTETDCSVVVGGEVLAIKGSNLHAEKLSVEDGEIVLNGNVTSLKFEEKKVKQGLFKRIFK